MTSWRQSGRTLGVSLLTRKLVSQNNITAVSEHLCSCGYSVSFSGFSILSSAQSNFILKVQESLLILSDKPVLNRQVASVPLLLFD